MPNQHIHKYQRVPLGSNGHEVFRCMLRNCSHYIAEVFVIGREAICWRCEKVHVVRKTRQNHVAVKPICEECRLMRRRKPAELNLDELLKKVRIS